MTGANFFHNLADRLIRLRVGLIALILLLTVFFFWRMQDLQFDNSNEIWFTEADPALKRLKEFQKFFGNDDFVYLLFDGRDLFQPDALRIHADLARDIRAQVPYLRAVTWIGNAEYIEADAEGIVISSFVNPGGTVIAEGQLRQRAMKEKLYRNSYLSSDGGTAGMLLEMAPYPQGAVEPRNEVVRKLREVLALPQYASLDIHVVGQPVLYTDYNAISFRESLVFFGICLLLQMLILYRAAKNLRDVAAPMFTVILSVVWTMGLIQTLGFKLNLFIILIPVLMLCVCIGDSMHIIDFFRQGRREGKDAPVALRQAIADTGYPCLYTSLTTAVGFLSFFAADIRPFQEMGMYAAIGVMAAYFLSLAVVVIMYGNIRPPHMGASAGRAALSRSGGPGRAPDIFDKFLEKVWEFNIACPGKILAGTVLIILVSLYGYAQVRFETNTARMLSPNLPLRQSYDYADQRMGGVMSVEIMFDTGEPEGIKNPEFLRDMERLQDMLDKQELVTKTISLIDILKKINEAMHGGEASFHTLPGKKETIAQYLLLYEMSDGKELDKMISFDGRVARLTARTRTLDTRQVRELTEATENFSKDMFKPGITLSVTGNLDWTRSMNDLLADGQRRSFLAALAGVTILMCMVLRSPRLGLLSMIPNIFPVLATLGLMGLTGLYMDMALVSFSAIIIGVVVDDTIHFLFHFREAFERGLSYEQALRDALLGAGRPILLTTLTLVCGFAVFLFSDVTGVAKFGGLGCFAFALAQLADFFVMPAVLLVCKPLGAAKNRHSHHTGHGGTA